MTAKVFLVLLYTGSALAATSGWEEAKQESNVVIGHVASMANDGNDTIVTIEKEKGEGTETYRVCSSFPGGDAMNLNESVRLHLLREALQHENVVKVTYDGPFQRCLDKVEIRRVKKADL